ncbi:MAG: L-arabinose transport system permease protein AraP [candidate division BRC1 bacterium ADurb.BinA364]|nr:MAG: L-arabinose transport system permease protein AraP [candidate division BRC1 bacterium ADurb.BinA364]
MPDARPADGMAARNLFPSKIAIPAPMAQGRRNLSKRSQDWRWSSPDSVRRSRRAPDAASNRLYALRRKSAPYVFLAPYVLVAGCFFLYPLINAAILTFYQTNGPKSRLFVGLSNFIFVLGDPELYTALKNTTIYAIFSIFLQLPLSLGLALLLNAREDRLKGFFRLVIFSPHLVGPVFVGVLFGVLFTPHYGLFNQTLQALAGWGLDQRWLEQPELIMPALIVTSLWMYVGFNMIYFLAALQNVDPNLVEAARIDGANAFQVFWNVTIPAIKPVAAFVVIMSTIGSFQLFELPYTLLKGTYGPKNAGLTMVGYLYKNAFESGDLGTGAAIGWLLAFIIFLISLAQIRVSGALRKEA